MTQAGASEFVKKVVQSPTSFVELFLNGTTIYENGSAFGKTIYWQSAPSKRIERGVLVTSSVDIPPVVHFI